MRLLAIFQHGTFSSSYGPNYAVAPDCGCDSANLLFTLRASPQPVNRGVVRRALRSIKAQMFTVTPLRGVIIGLYLTATIILLLVALQFGLRSPLDVYGRTVWWAKYEQVPIKQIIQDLEDRELIPLGTTWQDANVSLRRASLRLIAASPYDVLDEVAKQTDVTIQYKVGYHGNIIAAVHISSTVPGRGAAAPYPDVNLEREILSRANAPN